MMILDNGLLVWTTLCAHLSIFMYVYNIFPYYTHT